MSAPAAPLVLPGATLAEAFGITCPRATDIPPHLRPILPLLAAGHRRNQIAYALGIRRSCVDSRLGRLYALLGVHDRHSAVAVARQIGLLPDNPKGT